MLKPFGGCLFHTDYQISIVSQYKWEYLTLFLRTVLWELLVFHAFLTVTANVLPVPVPSFFASVIPGLLTGQSIRKSWLRAFYLNHSRFLSLLPFINTLTFPSKTWDNFSTRKINMNAFRASCGKKVIIRMYGCNLNWIIGKFTNCPLSGKTFAKPSMTHLIDVSEFINSCPDNHNKQKRECH